jgi:tetratricopeptide (TPR) repeat protein
VAHYAVAASLTADGDLLQATRSYEAAAAIFEALHAADPGAGSARRDLALTEKRLSGLLTAQGEFARALERSRRALRLDEAAARAHPENARERRDLSVSLVDLGEALVNTRDVAGSLPFFRRALAIRRDLLAADAQNELARRDVVSALTRLASALAAAGDGPAATAAIEEARKVLPKDEGMESQRSEQAAILARIHEAAGQPTEALRWWREARTLRLAQIRGAETAYAWLARVDYLDVCLGLGRALLARAARSPHPDERARLSSEALAVFDEGVKEAQALAVEKHLLGPKVRLADELRAGLRRAQDAQASAAAAPLAPAGRRSSP